jgi:membrane-associated phospholipid phosphatase
MIRSAPKTMRVVTDRLGRSMPHGWRDFWLQFVVFWTFNLSYEATRGLSDGARVEALENGTRVIDAERSLGLYFELDLQRWVVHDAPGLFLSAANWTYFNCQFTISFGFLLWVYFRRNYAFYFVRNVILCADFIGLFGYVAIPTAPPRLYPQLGFVDTLAGEVVSHQSGIIESFGNPYAAMPSLHTAYALTIGTTGVLVCRSLMARAIWAFYPLLVVYSIVATGNHFVLDAVAGAGVAGYALLLSLAIARGRVPARGRAPVGFLAPRTA